VSRQRFFISPQNLSVVDEESACVLLTELDEGGDVFAFSSKGVARVQPLRSSPGCTPGLIDANENLIAHCAACRKTGR
jgi:hypothetical protein